MAIRMHVLDREPIGLALRRFKKLLQQSGQLWEQRWHIAFISKTDIRRAKKFKKRLKARFATLQAKKAGKQPVDSIAEAAKTVWQRTGKP